MSRRDARRNSTRANGKFSAQTLKDFFCFGWESRTFRMNVRFATSKNARSVSLRPPARVKRLQVLLAYEHAAPSGQVPS
jgi:hypothetical protein